MIVRVATEKDAPQIAALWNMMIRNSLATFTTEEKTIAAIEELIAARTQSFWVAGTGSIGGFVTYGPFRSGPGYAATVEHSIILKPHAQGRGMGRALMECAGKHAQAQGIHTMIAAISSANPDAVGFHSALGFVQTGHLPQVGRKAGQWLDLILMQKTL